MRKHADVDEVRGWFAGRVPEDWFPGGVEVTVDRDEILVIGTLPDVELGSDESEAAQAAARAARIEGFREDTRRRRMRIAEEAQHRWRRKVSWGARCGDTTRMYTTLSVPAMTRLRMSERAVLDTLVEAGVARSRSHALAWCVRLVGRNQVDWIEDLRTALQEVDKVKAEGPA